ncbi:MAG TPA: hypothetical protein VMT04_06655 [Terriglobales bacterium]|nr:hypothetical protein [Terriglobales bacterium]
MFFKIKNKLNHQTPKTGITSKKEKEQLGTRPNKLRSQRTPFSSEAIDTSFVYFEEK